MNTNFDLNRRASPRPYLGGAGLRCPALLDYLHAYSTISEARSALARYLEFSNTRRPHTALDRRTLDAVYFDHLPLAAAA